MFLIYIDVLHMVYTSFKYRCIDIGSLNSEKNLKQKIWILILWMNVYVWHMWCSQPFNISLLISKGEESYESLLAKENWESTSSHKNKDYDVWFKTV